MKEILKEFGISPEGYVLERANQGLINDTFFVSRENQRKHVLQRINEFVFPDTGALAHNLEKTLPFLGASDYTRIEYRRTNKGELFHRSGNNELWRLMSYLPGSTSFHYTSDPKIAWEAGRILGVFHRQLASLSPDQMKITLPRFHNLDWRLEQYRAALLTAIPEDLERTTDLQDFITEMDEELGEIGGLNLPIRVCHNDTKLNNILFSENKKALCLIDLDTLMPGLFLYDFGDAIRTIANPAPEEETDLEKIGFSMEMFSAFVDGLAMNRSVFTGEEIESLSLGPLYMPFLHGLRAYSDFLQGNVYYKVSYPDENLDRARSLFRFAHLARSKKNEMELVLKERLG